MTDTTTTTTDFTKTVHIGRIPGYRKTGSPVFAKVAYRDGRLSISGVEGPMPSGDAHGGCGQIVMSWNDDYLASVELARGWTLPMLAQFRETWKRWHLNDMRAGSPIQETTVSAHRASHECPRMDWYTHIKSVLADAKVDPDPETGYSYGSAWLREDVPADILEWLRNLPESSQRPNWV